MTTVFKYQNHKFFQFFGEPYDFIYVVSIDMPYGLTTQHGQIAIAPDGEILGWRYGDEMDDNNFQTSRDRDVKYSIESIVDHTGSYFELTGSTLSKTWEVCYVQKQGNMWSDENCNSYDSFKDAIASINRELKDTIRKVETYQT